MTLLFLALLAGAIGWGVFAFNRLVHLRNQVRTAWADIDVQLQRRHDLVPQLVEITRGYAAHEKTTLETVTELRNKARAAHGASRQGQVETALEQALGRLLALREAYPELKANQNFIQLSEALVTVENHLQYARRFYNGAVRDYNNTTQRLPDLILARSSGFADAEFFQAEADSRAPAVVDLSS